MALLNWLGTRPAPASADKLRADLLALNRDTAPYVIRDCTADDPENADLVAEWRMREPAWYAAFGQAHLKRQFQVFMRLLPDAHEVQSMDWVWDARLSADSLSLGYAQTWKRGWAWERRFGVRPFIETTPSGERLAYRFSSSELKKPLRETAAANGWAWRTRILGRMPRGSLSETLRAERGPTPMQKWLAVWITALAFLGAFHMCLGALKLSGGLGGGAPRAPLADLLWLLPLAIGGLVAWAVWRGFRRWLQLD